MDNGLEVQNPEATAFECPANYLLVRSIHNAYTVRVSSISTFHFPHPLGHLIFEAAYYFMLMERGRRFLIPSPLSRFGSTER
jgi:hypothetical protein